MIKIENLSKYYNFKKNNQFLALNRINLNISEGEMISIIGPSGAGKTTLLKIIGTLLDYEEGKYLYNDLDIDTISNNQKSLLRNSDFGFVFQEFLLIDDYSVLMNVMTPLYFSKVKCNKKQIAERKLDELGISKLKNKYPRDLSGGEKQRCAIARALINSPKIILCDEPTGQLDSDNSIKILELLKTLNKQGITIIIVTHDDKISQSCNRIITMKDGMIINDETKTN